MTDFRIRLHQPDESTARALAFSNGNYAPDEMHRLLRLALHEIDCLRADLEAATLPSPSTPTPGERASAS